MSGILVFNQNYIGDVVFTLPALKSLREGYPGSYIEVVVGKNASEVLRENPYISSFTIRPRTYEGKKELLKEIRRKDYNICFSFSSGSVELAIFSLLSGCEKRLGFFNPLTFLFYNLCIKENQADYAVLDYLKLAIAGGGRKVSPIPEIFLSQDELKRGEEILQAMGMGNCEEIFGILLGGSTPFKRWHPPVLEELLAKLERRGKVLLFGDKGFRIFGEALAKDRRNLHSLAGYTSLREAIALLTFCSVFIGQDSGLTHISAALGVPTIGVYGVTDPKRTAPPGKRVKVIYNPPPCGPCWGKKKCGRLLCLETISAQEIMKQVEEMLEGVK